MMNLILSVAIVIGMQVVIVVVFYLIRRERAKDKWEFNLKISTLAEGLSMNSSISAYWNVLIIVEMELYHFDLGRPQRVLQLVDLPTLYHLSILLSPSS
jgi:hypothetical protein